MGVTGEDGMSKTFGRMNKGSTQLSPPLRNEEEFLLAEEMMVGSFEN